MHLQNKRTEQYKHRGEMSRLCWVFSTWQKFILKQHCATFDPNMMIVSSSVCSLDQYTTLEVLLFQTLLTHRIVKGTLLSTMKIEYKLICTLFIITSIFATV